MTLIVAPDRTEAADYYFTYIDQVPAGDIGATLEAQLDATLAILGAISEPQSLFRYAPDKWSIRQLLGHVTDTERVFTFRALWFARGFQDALPSFDQNVAMAGANADERSWASHVSEFRAVRKATLALFQHLPPAAWNARGVASGHPVTVRALAYITAGHVAHHVKILRERYLR
jgi:hypothetical protein